MITSFSATSCALLSGSMLPFITATDASLIHMENVMLCWSTSGLVGASIITFLPFSNMSAATMSATTVFPSPVGSMTRVSLSRHVSARRV